MSAATRLEALQRIQGHYAESLGLWAAEEPDLERLAVLAAGIDALGASLAGLAPGDPAAEAEAAREADRLRQAVATACAERHAEARQAWAAERQRAEALSGAYPGGNPAMDPQRARFLDDRR